MSTVLAITWSGDNASIDLVGAALEADGHRVVRFDTDRFPTEVQLSLTMHETDQFVLTDGDPADLGAVDAVWYRRARYGSGLPRELSAEMRQASAEEARRTLRGLLATLDVFQLDPVDRVERSKHKQWQLALARAAGLEIPRTLFSNDPAAVRAFAAETGHDLITKMLAPFAIHEDGEEKVVFTNRVTREDLEDLDGLALCPMQFQERLDKQLELRATVVGGEVFTASIDSASYEGAELDWRREGVDMVDLWQPYTLPPAIEAGLLQVMDQLELNYGAADFIVTPDGRHVFLEVNGAGEWFWLQRLHPIAEAIGAVLVNPNRRRVG